MTDQNIQFVGDAKSTAPSAAHSDGPTAEMVETMPVTLTDEDVRYLTPLINTLAEPVLEYSNQEKDRQSHLGSLDLGLLLAGMIHRYQ